MKQVSVTYKAPPGDAKVVEAFGHTFFDGKEETVEVDDNTLAKLQGNRMFKCGEPTDADEQEADPEKEKAEAEAAKAADDAKRIAQGGPPPQRGAVLKSEDYRTDEEKTADEKADQEKRDAQLKPDATRGGSGGAPDPNQPQEPKKKIPGEDEHGEAAKKPGSFPQAGRDK